jgi:hypothetical protein
MKKRTDEKVGGPAKVRLAYTPITCIILTLLSLVTACDLMERGSICCNIVRRIL